MILYSVIVTVLLVLSIVICTMQASFMNQYRDWYYEEQARAGRLLSRVADLSHYASRVEGALAEARKGHVEDTKPDVSTN